MFSKLLTLFSKRKVTPGNNATGDLSLTSSILHIEKVQGNLVFGAIPGLKCYFTAKVFATPSNHRRLPNIDAGINGGRISRLWISDDADTKMPAVLYDMGEWVFKPTTAMQKTAVAVMMTSWA